MTNTWTTMSKEEKLTRIFAMKAEGYTNKEIGEFYGVSENAVQKASKKAENQPIRSLDEIDKKPIQAENSPITFEMFSSLLEKLEILELEVATIKSLQVESAAIEKLKDSEFKFFVTDRRNNEEFKFKTVEDTVTFITSKTNSYITENYLEYQLKNTNVFDFKYLRITSDFKADVDVSNNRLETTRNDITDIYRHIAEIQAIM